MNSDPIITIIAIALFAFLGVIMAGHRNRNTTVWGVLCALFGVFGLLALVIVGESE
jgi:amino acid permease